MTYRPAAGLAAGKKDILNLPSIFDNNCDLFPGYCRSPDLQPDFHRPGRPEAAAAQETHREGAGRIWNQVSRSKHVCLNLPSKYEGLSFSRAPPKTTWVRSGVITVSSRGTTRSISGMGHCQIFDIIPS